MAWLAWDVENSAPNNCSHHYWYRVITAGLGNGQPVYVSVLVLFQELSPYFSLGSSPKTPQTK